MLYGAEIHTVDISDREDLMPKVNSLFEAGPLIAVTTFFALVQAGDSNLVLMQYTGIKDKNKKEIYEGDVVEVRIPEEYGGDLDEDGKEQYLCRQEVKISKESGGYYTIEDTGEYCPALGSDEVNVEVLGNVYENPKLLK